ncbi:hypothetical protein SBRCBS47491_004511 [Sporothrix bragantina]|uniref:Protein kinase domain-containing protein n=1 Tax=Sporothrix bragantina TaxID=671064 RepID=A0ABP0BP17_9PEZI
MPHEDKMTTKNIRIIVSGSDEDIALSTMIGVGVSGIVHLSPCGTKVIKSVPAWRGDERDVATRCKQLRNEIALYQYLPQNHPRLPRYIESVDDGEKTVALTLEYLPNATLHEYLRGYTLQQFFKMRTPKDKTQAEFEASLRRRHDSIPLRERARWCLEAADGIVMLHSHGVIHADLKPENMGVDANLGVRLLDLAGSARLGVSPALCLESTRYFMSRASWDIVNETTDCFALGSSIYHIVTGWRPYDSLPDDEVEARYERQEFPDLSGQSTEGPVMEKTDEVMSETLSQTPDTTGISPVTGQLLFANTIRGCWFAEFASAADVLESLKKEVLSTFDEADLAYIRKASGISL